MAATTSRKSFICFALIG